LARYEDLRQALILSHGARPGSWFGLPALKIEGKIFMALWLNGEAIFKLSGEDHAQALALDGASLFQPLLDRKPMREWVQIPPQHMARWQDFALAALAYVQSAATKTKK
jgi:hypothetical protein